jgi:hypothetical protein
LLRNLRLKTFRPLEDSEQKNVKNSLNFWL